MRVLGIETSCDETGIGVADSECGIIGQALFSQIDLHRPYGGVVPEIASRDHVQRLIPLVETALANESLSSVDAVAYTAGPGLIGALMTGALFGHSLAWSLGIPALAIHHLEAHLLILQMDNPSPQIPFIALLVSGGHTQLVLVEGLGRYRLLGETLDDAVGEAFDKTAKILGLPYPGGPAIEQLAHQGRPGKYEFPRPMAHKPGLDFSFSGLKTYVLNTFSDSPKDEQTKADIAYAFEQAAVAALVLKCRRALDETGISQLAVAGGVSANQCLRTQLGKFGKNGVSVFFPKMELCTDNGVMIAYAGLQRYQAGQTGVQWPEIRPRWSLLDLTVPGQG